MKKLLLISHVLLFSTALFTTSRAANTVLYAMTNTGGAHGKGAIISFTPATATEAVVWSFGSGTDGQSPYGNSLVYNATHGLFYGMTSGGGLYSGGTIFTFDPATNAENVVWNFGNGSDGNGPAADMTYDAANGLFYGQTTAGGTVGGIIFSFDPTTNTETVIYNFDGAVSADASTDFYYDASQGILIAPGTGGQYGAGDLFSINPSAHTVSDLWDFGNGTDGTYDYSPGAIAYDAGNGLFYLAMPRGGANNKGAIISFNLSAVTENVVYSFTSGTDAYNPNSFMAYDAGKGLFYGTSFSGGAHNQGAIFSFNPSTNAESVVYSFAGGTDGSNPWNSNLVYDATNGLFYLTTSTGGTNNTGTIVSFNPSDNTESVLWSFGTGTDGNSPQGSFAQVNSVTGINSLSNNAVSFEVYPNPSSGEFTVKSEELRDKGTIEVYNILGEKVYSNCQISTSSNYQIDLSSQPAGIYLYRVMSESGNLIGEGKLVLEK